MGWFTNLVVTKLNPHFGTLPQIYRLRHSRSAAQQSLLTDPPGNSAAHSGLRTTAVVKANIDGTPTTPRLKKKPHH